MASVDLLRESKQTSISLTSRRFSHRAVTNADYRAYAAASCAVSDQDECCSRDLIGRGSNLCAGSIGRQICLRNAGGAFDAARVAFRQRVITLDEVDPYADPLHTYRQQEFRTDGRGVRIPPAAPIWPGDRRAGSGPVPLGIRDTPMLRPSSGGTEGGEGIGHPQRPFLEPVELRGSPTG